MDSSGVSPALPAAGVSGGPVKIVRRAVLEDEVLASWLDILVADGLVPSRAVPGGPY